jgi:hypothetical protein
MPDSGQLALLLAQKLNFALTKLIRGSLQLTSESGFPAQHLRVSPIEPPDRNDYNVQVQADLSRLNAEQLIALKHLALIASAETLKRLIEAPIPLIDRAHNEKRTQEEALGLVHPVGPGRRLAVASGDARSDESVAAGRNHS